VLDEWEGATPLKQRARRVPIPDALSLVVGPEGGFSPDERAWMASNSPRLTLCRWVRACCAPNMPPATPLRNLPLCGSERGF
jgi:hypothetical protein